MVDTWNAVSLGADSLAVESCVFRGCGPLASLKHLRDQGLSEDSAVG